MRHSDVVKESIRLAQNAECKQPQDTYRVPEEKLRINCAVMMPDGAIKEMVERSLYIKALDEKQRAEELLEIARADIERLRTIIAYLENKK